MLLAHSASTFFSIERGSAWRRFQSSQSDNLFAWHLFQFWPTCTTPSSPSQTQKLVSKGCWDMHTVRLTKVKRLTTNSNCFQFTPLIRELLTYGILPSSIWWTVRPRASCGECSSTQTLNISSASSTHCSFSYIFIQGRISRTGEIMLAVFSSIGNRELVEASQGRHVGHLRLSFRFAGENWQFSLLSLAAKELIDLI